MNTCQRFDSLVSAFLEHEASPAEVRFVESHLPTCSRCRTQIHQVGLVMEAVNRLPRVETRPEFTDEVLARTRGLRPAALETREPWILAPRFTGRRMLQWGVPLAAAAALIMTLVSLNLTHRSDRAQTASHDAIPGTSQPAPAFPSPTTASNEMPSSRDGVVPPEVLHYGQGEGQSLGMARDSYAVGTYELRTPPEGGTPILTPVASRPDAPVVVTF